MSAEDTLTLELAEALAPPAELANEPSVRELASLQRAVRSRNVQTRRRRQRRWSRRTAGLTVVTMLAGAGTAAAATGHLPIPSPVRAIAHDLGLPVVSPEVHAVEQLTSDLRQARSKGDPTSVSHKAASLQHALTALGPHEAAAVQEHARKELATVGDAPPTVDAGTPKDGQPTDTTPTTDPPAPTDTTHPPTTEPSPTDPPTTLPAEEPAPTSAEPASNGPAPSP